MTSVIFLSAPEAPAEPAHQPSPAGTPGPIAVYRAPQREEIPAPVPALPRPATDTPAIAGPDPEGPVPGAGPRQANWSSAPEDDARVKAICQSVALAALEVLGGVRPLQQMARWLDTENYERLQLRTNLVRGLRDSPAGTQRPASDPRLLHRAVRIRSCHLCPVAEGVYEATVVAFEHNRARAVALRIQLRRGLWRITALEIG